ncbi:hypothetical protein BDZ91DRAFT_716396 [Kalaharituber pfeilii]|nr:hypothetical protein BDZ91DRAFT_716396 [Kalaharituber pfeilii]
MYCLPSCPMHVSTRFRGHINWQSLTKVLTSMFLIKVYGLAVQVIRIHYLTQVFSRPD